MSIVRFVGRAVANTIGKYCGNCGCHTEDVPNDRGRVDCARCGWSK